MPEDDKCQVCKTKLGEVDSPKTDLLVDGVLFCSRACALDHAHAICKYLSIRLRQEEIDKY